MLKPMESVNKGFSHHTLRRKLPFVWQLCQPPQETEELKTMEKLTKKEEEINEGKAIFISKYNFDLTPFFTLRAVFTTWSRMGLHCIMFQFDWLCIQQLSLYFNFNYFYNLHTYAYYGPLEIKHSNPIWFSFCNYYFSWEKEEIACGCSWNGDTWQKTKIFISRTSPFFPLSVLSHVLFPTYEMNKGSSVAMGKVKALLTLPCRLFNAVDLSKKWKWAAFYWAHIIRQAGPRAGLKAVQISSFHVSLDSVFAPIHSLPDF